MLAMIIYLNRFILFPKLFLKAKYLEFWCTNILLLLSIGFIEFQLVKLNVAKVLENAITHDEYIWSLITVFSVVTLRDAAFFAFFFIINTNRHIKQLLQHKEKLLAVENKQITISLSAQKEILVAIKDIVYISSERNCVTVHLINNKKYTQYHTLAYMEEILPKHLCVRINRSNIIMYRYVCEYDENNVAVRITEHYDKLKIPVLQSQRVEKFNQLKKHVSSETIKMNCELKKEEKNQKLRNKKDETCEINALSKQILETIREKPSIFASEIKKNFSHISERTIDNHLKQLKDLDLIEYKGSLKTGGYYLRFFEKICNK
jgi:DNA-binding transcriptional ArsR family regulator